MTIKIEKITQLLVFLKELEALKDFTLEESGLELCCQFWGVYQNTFQKLTITLDKDMQGGEFWTLFPNHVNPCLLSFEGVWEYVEYENRAEETSPEEYFDSKFNILTPLTRLDVKE